MDGERWEQLYRCAVRLSKRFHRRRVRYADVTVVMLYLWAAATQRPVSRACRAPRWPARWGERPSPATMSRRMRTLSVGWLLEALEKTLRQRLPRGLTRAIDARPLPVGGASKDKDARRGHGAGMIQKGYKLHVVYDTAGGVDAWALASMNRAEATVARGLIDQLDSPGYLLADSAYDSAALYRQADQKGLVLVARRKRPQAALGHRPQHPARLHAIDLLARPFGRVLYHHRDAIERYFGRLSVGSAALWTLPPWIRRPHRVAAWVQAKIILDSAARAA